MRLSIIIPTLNEARYLAAAVAAARHRATNDPPAEIIVSDCGSADGTRELGQRLGARVPHHDPPPDSRAAALNRGAAGACGDVLLFLDADTVVPYGYDRAI